MFRQPITQEEARGVLEILADSEIVLSEPDSKKVLIGEYFENPDPTDAVAILSSSNDIKTYIIAPFGDDKLEYEFSRDNGGRFKVQEMNCCGIERHIGLSSEDYETAYFLYLTIYKSSIPKDIHFEEIDYGIYLDKYNLVSA